MSGSPTVSVVVPLGTAPGGAASVHERVSRYLETTGFSFEIIAADGPTYGDALRKGVSEAGGRVIVVIDPELPYGVPAIGDAVALIEAGTTDVVYGTTGKRESRLLTWLLVPILPDRGVRLLAFSSSAAKLSVAETSLHSPGCLLEVGFLVNKYGFRVERLNIADPRGRPSLGLWDATTSALAVRRRNRRNAYRAARRCPVCFSAEVWTCAQVPANVVRACRRCKCRYLNQFAEGDDTLRVRRVLRPHAVVEEEEGEETHSPTAREKTSVRRLSILRKQMTSRARVLEIGIRDGSFGAAAAREFEYVGIDPATVAVRHARARGLEVYCSALAAFVNTGPAFDAITAFHVFEDMSDPHDALARMKDLIKPGGLLFLTTFDTEGLVFLLTPRRRMLQNFRTHLILYSRSALIELLENSGFEIEAISADFEYRDHRFLKHRLGGRWRLANALLRGILAILPDPLLVSSGSIRIVAKRRGGPSLNVRAIRATEPTHAR